MHFAMRKLSIINQVNLFTRKINYIVRHITGNSKYHVQYEVFLMNVREVFFI